MAAWASKAGFAVFLTVVLVWSLFPLYYAGITSLSTDTELFVPHYWPHALYLGNFADLFGRTRLLTGIFNSVIVGAATLAISFAVSLLAAYPIACITFPGRRLFMFAVLATTMFPQVAVLAGFYELARALHIYNTLVAVVLSYVLLVAPFMLWLLTAYMRALPREIEDIAIIDGAPPLTILLKVFLPLLWPGMAATGLLAFIAVWNEFLFAFTLTLTEDVHTAPVALAMLGGQTPHDLPWGDLMAASVVLTLPVAVLAGVFQSKMISGLTAGAVNG